MRKVWLLAAVSVLTLNGTEVFAASASGTGTAKATIVKAVDITETGGQSLDFGTILSGTNTVTIATDGTRSAATGGNLVASNNGKNGILKVNGEKNQVMTISTIPSTTVSNGGASMNVRNFVTDPAGQLTLGADGTGTINVGADLSVGEGQATGEYTGTYTVTVTY